MQPNALPLSLSRLFSWLLLAACYWLSAQVALQIVVPPDFYAAAIWPPAGIALIALLIWGKALWPGVLLGAALVQYQLLGSHFLDEWTVLGFSLSIALGATAQALLGAGLIYRWVSSSESLLKEREIIVFLLLGSVLSCLVSATVGSLALLAWDMTDITTLPLTWTSWWIGDSIGVILLVPLGILWQRGNSFEHRVQGSVVILASFLITFVFFLYAVKKEQDYIEQSFFAEAEKISLEMRRKLDSYLNALLSLEHFFISSHEIERVEFQRFTLPFLQKLQGIQALESHDYPQVA